MEMRETVEISVDNQIEEQYILEKFPEAVWVSPAGFGTTTRFFLPSNRSSDVREAIQEWEERGM